MPPFHQHASRAAVRSSWRLGDTQGVAEHLGSPSFAPINANSGINRRIAKYQRRFRSELIPPPGSEAWPGQVLKRWYRDGGVLSCSAAMDLGGESGCSFIEFAGAGLPVRHLEPTILTTGGLLAAAARGEMSLFRELANQLESKGFALAELGAPEGLWGAVCAEGEQLWPQMRPGILASRDGTTSSGLSPSGMPRGDRCLSPLGCAPRLALSAASHCSHGLPLCAGSLP